jgi:calcium-dependent protein kinase
MKMHEVYFEQPRDQGRATNGNIYLITELCEGGDLFSRILHHYKRLKQPMTESHVAFMMQQILSATKYCHSEGIVHRDIKPENILFVDRSSSSLLKIIDFGLSNFADKIREEAKEVKMPRTGTMGWLARRLPSNPVNGKHIIPWHERKKVMQKAGTPHYMAPEMIEGNYDQKADVFSIGIILCQLFTGWHPFYEPEQDDEASVRAKISDPKQVRFPPEVWEPVSLDAKDLCQRLLEKKKEDRLSAAQALEHRWFKDPDNPKPSPFGNVSGLSASIFDGLMQYQAYNKLRRAVLQLLTRELSEYQIQELRKKFMSLDTQGDGLLSPEELIEGMQRVGYGMSSDELDQIMDALDGTGRKRIGYKEFISALIERRVKFDRQQLRECFKKFDPDNTGVITYENVKRTMKDVTESEWQDIATFGSKDANQRPQLTFDEFVALMEQSE